MIHLTIEAGSSASGGSPATGRLVAAVTLLGWIVLVGLIGSAYVGHSSSPYGVCYAASGRTVPCALVRR